MDNKIEPVPAATVITVRQSRQDIEILMLKKNSKLAYGGMWVFPGGKIDKEDYKHSAQEIIDTAKNAAVREAKEEADISLNAEELHFFSHWTTPTIRPKRFSTWFFIGEVDSHEVVIDGEEIHDHAWRRPKEILKDHEQGIVALVPPTFISLLKLSQFTSYQEFIKQLKKEQPEIFKPRVAQINNQICHLYQEDAGYEATDPLVEGSRHRLICPADGPWIYTRK